MNRKKALNRRKLIQAIFKQTNFDSYLEIGVFEGFLFLPIRCKKKVAVDPEFKMSSLKKAEWNIRNPFNLNNIYFEETSDEFFKRSDFLKKFGPFDVVFVDGLHTFRASLRDTLNSLNHLNDNGVIVLHDCLPPNKVAAMETKTFPTPEEQQVEGWNGMWCGDVWKSIVYLRRAFPEELEVYVLDADYGLGVVRKKQHQRSTFEMDEKVFAEVDQISYEKMRQNTSELLGLKNAYHAQELVREIAGQADRVNKANVFNTLRNRISTNKVSV